MDFMLHSPASWRYHFAGLIIVSFVRFRPMVCILTFFRQNDKNAAGVPLGVSVQTLINVSIPLKMPTNPH